MREQRDDEATKERLLADQLNELENLQLAKMRLEQENERGAEAARLIESFIENGLLAVNVDGRVVPAQLPRGQEEFEPSAQDRSMRRRTVPYSMAPQNEDIIVPGIDGADEEGFD